MPSMAISITAQVHMDILFFINLFVLITPHPKMHVDLIYFCDAYTYNSYRHVSQSNSRFVMIIVGVVMRSIYKQKCMHVFYVQCLLNLIQVPTL